MSFQFAVRGAFAAGSLLALSLAPAVAQDAQAILKKVGDTYTSAKTYQADYVANVNSPQGAMTMTISIKKAGEKIRLGMTTTGGNVPPGAGDMMLVDDGKTAYTYMGAMKAYSKGPHNPKATQMTGVGMPQDFTKDVKSVKLLPPATVNGKAAYALEMTGKKPGSTPMTMYVDRATYRLLQIKQNGGPQGAVTMNVKNEVLNGPLPASAFVFTPPPGAKLIQGGPGAPRR